MRMPAMLRIRMSDLAALIGRLTGHDVDDDLDEDDGPDPRFATPREFARSPVAAAPRAYSGGGSPSEWSHEDCMRAYGFLPDHGGGYKLARPSERRGATA